MFKVCQLILKISQLGKPMTCPKALLGRTTGAS